MGLAFNFKGHTNEAALLQELLNSLVEFPRIQFENISFYEC